MQRDPLRAFSSRTAQEGKGFERKTGSSMLEVYDRLTHVALVHVVALEELPSPTGGSNGVG
jgi:hypothetical protein